MDATSDDLLKPLGVDRPEGGPRRSLSPTPRVLGAGLRLSAVLALALLAIGAALAITAGLLGGGDRQMVAGVEPRPAREPDPPRLEAGGGARAARRSGGTPAAQRSAAEVETASGVSVVRPNGAGAPASLVIRIPDAAVTLNSAPDSAAH